MLNILRCIIYSWFSCRCVLIAFHSFPHNAFIMLYFMFTCFIIVLCPFCSILICKTISLVDFGMMLCLMQSILPPTTNIPEAYAHGSSEEQVSLCNFMKQEAWFTKLLVKYLSDAGFVVLCLGLYTEFGTVLHLIFQGRVSFLSFLSICDFIL